jgi:hypothetical protein
MTAVRRRRSGGGKRRQAAGRVVLWPRRYWPQRAVNIDAAIIQAYRLYCHGVIGSVEVTVRETELRAMRGWVR